MKQPTMVYKYPGTMHKCNVTKDRFDYKVVEGEAEAGEKSAVDEALASGWFASTKEAKDAAQDVPTLEPVAPPPAAPVKSTLSMSTKKGGKKTKDKGSFL